MFKPKTTEDAIAQFRMGVTILNGVTARRNLEAEAKSESAAQLVTEANEAREDAAHASRIAKRFDDLLL